MNVEDTKRLLHNGEVLKPGDEIWTENGDFVDVREVGRAGGTVCEDDFVLRPPKNEVGS